MLLRKLSLFLPFVYNLFSLEISQPSLQILASSHSGNCSLQERTIQTGKWVISGDVMGSTHDWSEAEQSCIFQQHRMKSLAMSLAGKFLFFFNPFWSFTKESVVCLCHFSKEVNSLYFCWRDSRCSTSIYFQMSKKESMRSGEWSRSWFRSRGETFPETR